MNSATITKLNQVTHVIRGLLKISAWILGIYTGLICFMTIQAGKDFWTNSDLIWSTVAAIAAYILVPHLIYWTIENIVERAVIANAKNAIRKQIPGLKPVHTSPKLLGIRLF